MSLKEKRKKQAEYLRKWRAQNKDKARAIQARYYYSNRDRIIVEYGYRIADDMPGGRGAFDPVPLRAKRIYIDATRSDPLRSVTRVVFDFNDSLIGKAFLDESEIPRNISFVNRQTEIPSLPSAFLKSLVNLDSLVDSISRSSVITSCAIVLLIVSLQPH